MSTCISEFQVKSRVMEMSDSYVTRVSTYESHQQFNIHNGCVKRDLAGLEGENEGEGWGKCLILDQLGKEKNIKLRTSIGASPRISGRRAVLNSTELLYYMSGA